jgi:superfamily I DNA/RNA helicase
VSDEVRGLLQMRYPHIYVDEYQDTNNVQVSIIKQLITPDSYLTVVGDDTQSIYSFQGSQVEKIRRFASDFPGADVVVLDENYRSSPPVVAYVNAVNATCAGAFHKTLISRGARSEIKPKRAIFNQESHEANWVVQEIERLISEEQVPLSEIAVLFRIGSIAAPLEKKLIGAGIPFTREGGMKFTDLKHIQFFISFLELLGNPYDWLAWEVLLPAIPNIGEKMTEVIIKDLQSNQGNWRWTQPPVFSLGHGKRLESLLNFWQEMLDASEIARGEVRVYLEQGSCRSSKTSTPAISTSRPRCSASPAATSCPTGWKITFRTFRTTSSTYPPATSGWSRTSSGRSYRAPTRGRGAAA